MPAGINGPRWLRGEIERPAGTKNMGTPEQRLFYTPEQQARLGVDEEGNDVAEDPKQGMETALVVEEPLAEKKGKRKIRKRKTKKYNDEVRGNFRDLEKEHNAQRLKDARKLVHRLQAQRLRIRRWRHTQSVELQDQFSSVGPLVETMATMNDRKFLVEARCLEDCLEFTAHDDLTADKYLLLLREKDWKWMQLPEALSNMTMDKKRYLCRKLIPDLYLAEMRQSSGLKRVLQYRRAWNPIPERPKETTRRRPKSAPRCRACPEQPSASRESSGTAEPPAVHPQREIHKTAAAATAHGKVFFPNTSTQAEPQDVQVMATQNWRKIVLTKHKTATRRVRLSEMLAHSGTTQPNSPSWSSRGILVERVSIHPCDGPTSTADVQKFFLTLDALMTIARLLERTNAIDALSKLPKELSPEGHQMTPAMHTFLGPELECVMQVVLEATKDMHLGALMSVTCHDTSSCWLDSEITDTPESVIETQALEKSSKGSPRRPLSASTGTPRRPQSASTGTPRRPQSASRSDSTRRVNTQRSVHSYCNRDVADLYGGHNRVPESAMTCFVTLSGRVLA